MERISAIKEKIEVAASYLLAAGIFSAIAAIWIRQGGI